MSLVIFLLVLVNSLMVESDPDSNFTVKCFEDMFAASWTSPAIDDRDVYIDLIDISCNKSVVHNSTASPTTFLMISSDYDKCGTNITEVSDTIIIRNTARVKITQKLRGGLTQREYYYHYNIECTLKRNINISTGDQNYTVSEKIIILQSYNETKNFSMAMSMKFYKADYSAAADTPLVVNSDDNIYVGIKESITDGNKHFKFIVNECFATPTVEYDGTTRDVFFEKKCSLDNTFAITSPDFHNITLLKFQIQAFLFIQDRGSVYFHCRLFICKQASNSSECTQYCSDNNQRYRRDVSRERRSTDSEVLQEIILTSQKIVFDNTKTCKNISPTCPLHSTCHALEPAACICDDGYVFSRETKTCTSQRRLEIKGVHLNLEWKDIYADTSSLAFRKLAMEKEELLYRLFQATETDRDIEGIKVVGARKGSVVLDVEIIYAKETTYENAYKSFIKSITTDVVKATTLKRSLNIIQDTTPSVHEITKDTNKMEKVTLVIVVVVLLVVLFISGITFYKVKQLRRATTKEDISAFDNRGIDMNNMS